MLAEPPSVVDRNSAQQGKPNQEVARLEAQRYKQTTTTLCKRNSKP